MTGMMTSPSVKAERTSSKEEIKVWVYYKGFCTWGHLTNCRWLKILILNYLTSPGHLKSFFSVSYFSNVKTNLELFFPPGFTFLFFVHLPIHLFSFLKPSASHPLLSFFFMHAISHRARRRIFALLSEISLPNCTSSETLGSTGATSTDKCYA